MFQGGSKYHGVRALVIPWIVMGNVVFCPAVCPTDESLKVFLYLGGGE